MSKIKKTEVSHQADFPVPGPLGDTFHKYFLDYAGYVVTERAVPDLRDGLKPVQRRLLFSMFGMHDGRLHKAANIIGQTMRLHPHGDKSIEDALVNLAHRGILIETQGNWGNALTGDSAAAPRYIEARLSEFARTILFNNKITSFIPSYDERAEEPEALPAKFPLVLYLGVEGIAVGLSTKIFPHNPLEICDAAIKFLKGEKLKLIPDFLSGGEIDTSEYDDGMQGGAIRHRAKLEFAKNSVLEVSELPYGVTPESFIKSVVAAQKAGFINLKKIEDNSTKTAKISVYLKDLDDNIPKEALKELFYLKTKAEEKLHPSACIIENKRPIFLSVTEMLKRSVTLTKDLLKKELELSAAETEEKLHALSLEEAFIRGGFYKDLEKYTSEETAISDLIIVLSKYLKNKVLLRKIESDDIKKLLSLPMRRITKFDHDKAKETQIALDKKLAEIKNNLKHLTDFAIAHFNKIKAMFPGYTRKSKIVKFPESLALEKVKSKIQNSVRDARPKVPLMFNSAGGLVGNDLKIGTRVGEISIGEEFVVITESGKIKVQKFKGRHMLGEPILFCAPYRRGDDKTKYTVVFEDLVISETYAKRFTLPQIILDKDYLINPFAKNYDEVKAKTCTKIWYVNVSAEEKPSGDITLYFVKTKGLKVLKKNYNFKNLLVKGRDSRGNLLSKNKIEKSSNS